MYAEQEWRSGNLDALPLKQLDVKGGLAGLYQMLGSGPFEQRYLEQYPVQLSTKPKVGPKSTRAVLSMKRVLSQMYRYMMDDADAPHRNIGFVLESFASTPQSVAKKIGRNLKPLQWVDGKQIENALAKGVTAVFNSVELWEPAVAKLCLEVSQLTGRIIGVNMYATGPEVGTSLQVICLCLLNGCLHACATADCACSMATCAC